MNLLFVLPGLPLAVGICCLLHWLNLPTPMSANSYLYGGFVTFMSNLVTYFGVVGLSFAAAPFVGTTTAAILGAGTFVSCGIGGFWMWRRAEQNR